MQHNFILQHENQNILKEICITIMNKLDYLHFSIAEEMIQDGFISL